MPSQESVQKIACTCLPTLTSARLRVFSRQSVEPAWSAGLVCFGVWGIASAQEMLGRVHLGVSLCIGIAAALPQVRAGARSVCLRHEALLFLWQVAAREAQASAPQEVPVRLLDATGASSNAGLVQVQIGDSSFGTVCGMTLAAADVVCRQLGLAYSCATLPWAGTL